MDLRRIFGLEFHLLNFHSEVPQGRGGGAGNNRISPLHSRGDPKCEMEVLKKPFFL